MVFERLFGDGESTEPTARMARLESQKSVLDYVTAQPDAPAGHASAPATSGSSTNISKPFATSSAAFSAPRNRTSR